MRQSHKNCVLGAAALLLSASGALASPFTVTTTGTITSGSDPANLLGAGTGLIGSTYTLSVGYSGLCAGYYTDGSGQFALDVGDAIPGTITLTIVRVTLSTALLSPSKGEPPARASSVMSVNAVSTSSTSRVLRGLRT